MGKVQIAAFAATSDEIPGRRFHRPDDPLYHNHDQRLPVSSRLLLAEMRRTDSGSLGLRVEREIDEDDLARLGDSGGYSVTFAKEAVALDPGSDKPTEAAAAHGLAEAFGADEVVMVGARGVAPTLSN